MQKLCCVRTRQQFSASLDYFITSSPPYLHQFSTISGGNCIIYDPSDPVVDENDFERRDWASSEFGHVEGKEEFPANMPEPRGHGFIMRGSGCRSCIRYSVNVIKNWISYIFELCPCILVEQEANIS